MKNHNFLFEYVSYEELYEAYVICRKRKRRTENALSFEIDDSVKLFNLWIELNSLSYKIGKSIAFVVDKPVKREVFAADFRDRIIHHLFVNRMNDIFEKEFIDDSYSCRVGKGTLYGIRRCYECMKDCSDNFTKDCYIFKGDLKGFFMSIDKRKLYEVIYNLLLKKYEKGSKELEWMAWVLKLIIFNMPQRNCIKKQSDNHWKDLPKDKSLFYCDENHGIPIGNLTSQIFANLLMSEFDHYIKDFLHIEYYGRYVDDFFIIMKDKEKLKEITRLIKIKLNSMGVLLHPKKHYLQHYSKGVQFIGGIIKPNRTYISNRTKNNFYISVRKFGMYAESNNLEIDEIQYIFNSINSYLGFLKHHKTYNIRHKVLFSYWMYCLSKWMMPNKNYNKVEFLII